jgi:iron complex transport system substrate-binding protein
VPAAGPLVFFLLVFLAALFPMGRPCPASAGQGGAARIVSLSPGVTETLFALGLGKDVVGVTRFCSYPQEACALPKVGGYIDPNYEAIVALSPTVAVLLPEQAEVGKNLASLGIKSITVDNKTVEDILGAITTLGSAFGAADRAGVLTARLRARMDAVRRRSAGLARPSVLVSIARGMGSLGMKTVYIAGRGSYFDQLVEMAGGLNAYRKNSPKFPRLSWEGLLSLDPDIIIDLVPSLEKKGWKKENILGQWSVMKGLRAVDEGRVHVLGKDYVTIPGPRFILLLEDMAEAIHPGDRTMSGRRE